MLENLKKISVIGHFAQGENLLNGQTVKTKIITKELENLFGKMEVLKIDTHGDIKALKQLPLQCFRAIKHSKNIVILPAENGLRVITPLLLVFNLVFSRSLHYVVIGGWLPDFLSNKKWLSVMLKRFDGIYVETSTMKEFLEEKGFRNIAVIPNCKELIILQDNQLKYSNTVPYKLCTFSRVMKEKGIELAIEAVKMANAKSGKIIFSLDIYGQVDSNQIEWFEKLKKNFPYYIHYGGLVPFDKSTDVLKEYFALLFPTFYEGEGFAGTLIDALAAGVPVIASDWKYNGEIIKNGKTGKIIRNKLDDELIYLYQHHDEWNDMKVDCLQEAKKYLPRIAMRCLIEKLQ